MNAAAISATSWTSVAEITRPGGTSLAETLPPPASIPAAITRQASVATMNAATSAASGAHQRDRRE